MAALRRIYGFFISLRTAIWSMGLLIALFLAGAFIMPVRPEFRTIHAAPLLIWLKGQPLGITWWLWISIGLLAVLAVNTLLCSIESVIKKRKAAQWPLLISPQIIHIGFLFILLAHLLSSTGSAQGMAVAREGDSFGMPDGKTILHIRDINMSISPGGDITDWAVDIEYLSQDSALMDTIKPNSPSLHEGLNINVKDLRAFPEKAVLLQVSKDPGAPWALAGGVLFMAGIMILVALKTKAEGQAVPLPASPDHILPVQRADDGVDE